MAFSQFSPPKLHLCFEKWRRFQRFCDFLRRKNCINKRSRRRFWPNQHLIRQNLRQDLSSNGIVTAQISNLQKSPPPGKFDAVFRRRFSQFLDILRRRENSAFICGGDFRSFKNISAKRKSPHGNTPATALQKVSVDDTCNFLCAERLPF